MRNPIRRVATIASLTLATLGFSTSTAFQAAEQNSETTYEVRPLGGLDGSNSRGHGVNDWGLVSGFSNLADGKGRRAVLWFKGRMLQLEPIGGTNSTIPWSGPRNCRARTYATSGLLDAGGTAEAWGVNDRGQVVGTTCSPAACCRAFLWQNGEMKDFDLMKGDYRTASSTPWTSIMLVRLQVGLRSAVRRSKHSSQSAGDWLCLDQAEWRLRCDHACQSEA